MHFIQKRVVTIYSSKHSHSNVIPIDNIPTIAKYQHTTDRSNRSIRLYCMDREIVGPTVRQLDRQFDRLLLLLAYRSYGLRSLCGPFVCSSPRCSFIRSLGFVHSFIIRHLNITLAEICLNQCCHIDKRIWPITSLHLSWNIISTIHLR